MILVDTSVWIDHFRRTNSRLAAALDREDVLVHPFVIGEIACGDLRNRRVIVALLRRLPEVPRATDDEALAFVEHRSLSGRGIGLDDVHLLASVVLHGTARLWTADRQLAEVAADLGLLEKPG